MDKVAITDIKCFCVQKIISRITLDWDIKNYEWYMIYVLKHCCFHSAIRTYISGCFNQEWLVSAVAVVPLRIHLMETETLCFCVVCVYVCSRYCCRLWLMLRWWISCWLVKGSPYSITERRVPELIPVCGSQPEVTWVINPTVGCHYFLPGLRLPPQPLRGLLPVLLLGEQRHNGCEQFA